jgi:two-component system cell cycle response regulator
MGDCATMGESDSSLRIIVAEDDAALRTLLVRQLERAGYSVVACENGRVALEAVRQAGACTVLADWNMPELDGVGLLRAIRELSELDVLPFVYFVLLTADSHKDAVIAGLEAGADDYLTKPYHPQELLARLRCGDRIQRMQAELRDWSVQVQNTNAELATMNAKLERLAKTDELTGLSNRRHLFERLTHLWQVARRHERPLSCALLDIDHFKHINDTHGHAAGDAVLRALADVCRKCLRASDLAARIGGEEFCVICPETDAAGAASVAERTRAAIEAHDFRIDGKRMPVTASFGVAGSRTAHAGLEQMIAAADAMLYRAKSAGRNQVWVADEIGRELGPCPPVAAAPNPSP